MNARLASIEDCPEGVRVAEAAARIGQGLSICQLCEEWFPEELLSAIEGCCAACLAGVGEQNTRSRRGLLLRVLEADLRRIPGLAEADVARITGIVEAAWA